MKVCIINSFYYPDVIGGAEISVLKLAEGLRNKGHEVHVLCTSKITNIESINGINVHRVKINNTYDPIDVVRNDFNKSKIKWYIYKILDIYNFFNKKILINKIREINPDVIHINNIYGISSVIWNVVSKLDIPMVHTLRDYDLIETSYKLKDFIRAKLFTKLTNKVDAVTAPSNYTLKQFITKGYFKSSEKDVIYNAIDYNESDTKLILQNRIKQMECKKKVTFVYLGRLEKEKGIEFLIKSFSNIKNDSIELIIAGKGHCEEFVQKAVQKDSRINYIGFINESEKEQLLLDSDILIIPSLWSEPFGRVIIEAYKYAMPVIGTNVGGIPEIIKDRKSGILIEPDMDALINAINYYSKKQNIIKTIENIPKIISDFSIDDQCIKFIELYKEIIKNKYN